MKRGAICGDKRVACIPSKAAEERPLLASVKSGQSAVRKTASPAFFFNAPQIFRKENHSTAGSEFSKMRKKKPKRERK